MANKKKTERIEVSANEATPEPESAPEPRPDNNDRFLLPPVTIGEADDEIVVVADLPGVSKEAVNIEVDNQVLTVEGELHIDFPADMQATQAELAVPRFRRAFRLGHEVDPDKIEASLEDGVLCLRLGKKRAARRHRIEISA